MKTSSGAQSEAAKVATSSTCNAPRAQLLKAELIMESHKVCPPHHLELDLCLYCKPAARCFCNCCLDHAIVLGFFHLPLHAAARSRSCRPHTHLTISTGPFRMQEPMAKAPTIQRNEPLAGPCSGFSPPERVTAASQ